MPRRPTVIALAAVAATALTLGTAGATHTVTIKSKITIESHDLNFHGRVKSKNDACKDHRRVVLYRKLSDGHRQAMGAFTTGPSGRWHITVSGFAGVSLSHFYARVKRRSEGAAGTIYVCKSARSETTRAE